MQTIIGILVPSILFIGIAIFFAKDTWREDSTILKITFFTILVRGLCLLIPPASHAIFGFIVFLFFIFLQVITERRLFSGFLIALANILSINNVAEDQWILAFFSLLGFCIWALIRFHLIVKNPLPETAPIFIKKIHQAFCRHEYRNLDKSRLQPPDIALKPGESAYTIALCKCIHCDHEEEQVSDLLTQM